MAPKVYLTEKEKMDIIFLAKTYKNNWTYIGQTIGKSPNTCKHFYERYQNNPQLFLKMGRPSKITDEEKKEVVNYMIQDPLQNLNDISEHFNYAPSTIKDILNQNKIKYFERIPVTPLTNEHKRKRVEICKKIISVPYLNMMPIIFSDESSIEIQEVKGIWRQQGTYPPQTFYPRDVKQMSVMIWGGIGPDGYRTKLIFFDQHINSETYIESLKANQIFENIRAKFGDKWVWQQDNAPSHKSQKTIDYLQYNIPYLFDWPAKSPDLSPIEQIWNYLKVKIRGKTFKSQYDLFKALEKEWNNIPNEVIHNLYSSYWARCYVCAQNDGNSLNGHWKEVRKIHDSYRK